MKCIWHKPPHADPFPLDVKEKTREAGLLNKITHRGEQKANNKSRRTYSDSQHFICSWYKWTQFGLSPWLFLFSFFRGWLFWTSAIALGNMSKKREIKKRKANVSVFVVVRLCLAVYPGCRVAQSNSALHCQEIRTQGKLFAAPAYWIARRNRLCWE